MISVINLIRLHQVKWNLRLFNASKLKLDLITDQLDQIRQSSLARLMCDNNDGSVTTMQPFAMKSPVGT